MRESSKLLGSQAGFGQGVSNVPQMSGQVTASRVLGPYLRGLTQDSGRLPGKSEKKSQAREKQRRKRQRRDVFSTKGGPAKFSFSGVNNLSPHRRSARCDVTGRGGEKQMPLRGPRQQQPPQGAVPLTTPRLARPFLPCFFFFTLFQTRGRPSKAENQTLFWQEAVNRGLKGRPVNI